MDIYSLNGKWRMKKTAEKSWIGARVPGSVFSDLLREGLMEDPFYRDNEDKAVGLSYHDYEYKREFDISPEMLEKDRIFLYCEGLDTITQIRINSRKVARTNNMHRRYEFDIKKLLKAGRNSIHIIFYSPTKFIRKIHKKNPLWGGTLDVAMPGFYHLRKANCMFGWDWGPRIPDSGIWRDIGLKLYNKGRLKDIYVTQEHRRKNVVIGVQINFEVWTRREVYLEVLITPPGRSEIIKTIKIKEGDSKGFLHFKINDPMLWWPNGYGEQPLYGVRINLKYGDNLLDSKDFMIGLRTIDIRQKKDRWGKSFEFVVNGVPIFAKGANYIIEDSLMPRYSEERTEKLINDCIEANFNCIRVWGGGIYPPDYFYDLCDRYGLIVWQDFMFACSVDPQGRKITENIKKELEDNIKRIRNHACLGLWCGNNEIEWMIHIVENKPPEELKIPQIAMLPKLRQMKNTYINLFEKSIPEIVRKYDPERFYWPSSPSSGGKFNNPNGSSIGDVHYWEVWHELKPFEEYRKHYFRFTSEFGFQSFPGIKTIKSFTIPDDRNIFSYVMEKHQKNGLANGKILTYLSETFKYPKDFESLLYTSQILQAEAIKYGVEHWRRNRGRCMGSLYWQLNDCWPVASWSGIDYFGRWKALHYYARRFYSPVLISAEDSNGKTVNIYVTNDTRKSIQGVIEWRLRDNKSGVISRGSKEVSVPSLKARECMKLSFKDVINEDNIREVYLEFFLNSSGQFMSYGTLLFVKPKYFNFLNPKVKATMDENNGEIIITVESRAFAKSVEIILDKIECKLSDNYFDLSGGCKKIVKIKKSDLSAKMNLGEIEEQLQIRSLYDIEER
jgi:beta-mannosidase